MGVVKIEVYCIWEHNGNDSLIYADNFISLQERKTFYGQVPITAQQMYDHIRGVNNYYFGEIGVDTDNNGNIVECRKRSFEQLESTQNYLDNKLFIGSYEEEWTLRKVCRRFIWHDRIHAKAMFKMACMTFGKETIPNIFSFSV